MERKLSIGIIQRISSKYGTTLHIDYHTFDIRNIRIYSDYLFLHHLYMSIDLLIKNAYIVFVRGKVNLSEVRVPARCSYHKNPDSTNP